MSDFIVGLGLFLVIEGLAYALAPSLIRAAAARLPEITDGQLRAAGVAGIAFGVLVVWFVRR